MIPITVPWKRRSSPSHQGYHFLSTIFDKFTIRGHADTVGRNERSSTIPPPHPHLPTVNSASPLSVILLRCGDLQGSILGEQVGGEMTRSLCSLLSRSNLHQALATSMQLVRLGGAAPLIDDFKRAESWTEQGSEFPASSISVTV
jgi:hypothetical protein